MDISKVKAPKGSKRYYRSDSSRRFYNSFQVSYENEISAKTKNQGFKGYDLAVHDLLAVHGYSRSEVEQIILERCGEKYLIGTELEIEGVEDRARISKILKRYLPDRHVCVPDGSIDRSTGIEIVTSPLAPTEVGRIAWYNLLRSLSRSGCRSHDSGKCGLHVSISRSYLKDRTWKALRSLLSKERSLFETLSRRLIGRNVEDPFQFCDFSVREEKYQALNLGKSSVAEFRFFRGTLAPASFIASIEIIRSLVEYTSDRENRSSGKVPRLSIKHWIAYVRSHARFGVACEYIKDHADLHLARPKPLPVARSQSHKAARFLLRCRRSGLHVGMTGSLYIENLYGYGNDLIGGMATGTPQPSIESIEYQIPILWDRCHNLPQYIRDLVTRGKAPTTIAVRSMLIADGIDKRGISFSYYRSGWGRNSQLHMNKEYL